MSASTNIPTLYVEGSDDVSIISALLRRHGIDTQGGKRHLFIHQLGDLNSVLSNMTEAIRNANDKPVGFVIDIDIEIVNRWRSVQDRIKGTGVTPTETCPDAGYIGQVADYPHPFGVWLMPDCKTDSQYVEDLCITLLPNHPLWDFAIECTKKAAETFDKAIANEPTKYAHCRGRFKNIHERKAYLHTWLSWQDEPGIRLGAAINATILGHDSVQAIALLKWIKTLFGFPNLTV